MVGEAPSGTSTDNHEDVVQHRYDTQHQIAVTAAAHQSQPLDEAVAEALAGPSGIQTVSSMKQI